MANKSKEPEFIYICIDGQDNFVGCFKDEKSVIDYVERNAVEEARVFKVVAVFDCIAPEEPAYEFIDLKLKDVLEGRA